MKRYLEEEKRDHVYMCEYIVRARNYYILRTTLILSSWMDIEEGVGGD